MYLTSPKKWLSTLLVCTAISTSLSHAAISTSPSEAAEYVAQFNNQECRQLTLYAKTLANRVLETSQGMNRYGIAQIKLYELLISESSPFAGVILEAIDKLEKARNETNLSKEFLKIHQAGSNLVAAKCPVR